MLKKSKTCILLSDGNKSKSTFPTWNSDFLDTKMSCSWTVNEIMTDPGHSSLLSSPAAKLLPRASLLYVLTSVQPPLTTASLPALFPVFTSSTLPF